MKYNKSSEAARTLCPNGTAAAGIGTSTCNILKPDSRANLHETLRETNLLITIFPVKEYHICDAALHIGCSFEMRNFKVELDINSERNWPKFVVTVDAESPTSVPPLPPVKLLVDEVDIIAALSNQYKGKYDIHMLTEVLR